MRTEWNVDTSHGEQRPIVIYIPETPEDVEELEKRWAAGEVGVGRDDETQGRRFLRIDEGVWRWITDLPAAEVDEAHKKLVDVLRVLRPAAGEAVPAVMILPSYYGKVVGIEGVEEIAEQARLLLGDDELLESLGDNSKKLVLALAMMDVPSVVTEDELATAPGIFIPQDGEPQEGE